MSDGYFADTPSGTGTPALASAEATADCACPPAGGVYAGYFPNVPVRTHDNRLTLFYNDLLRGKIVMIHCISMASDVTPAVLDNLAQVQRLLGDRLGRDVFLYSLTLDPMHDTPHILRDVAATYGVGPGWWLLRSTVEVTQTLRHRLFASVDSQSHPTAQDGALGLVRYGNEPLGLWGAVPAKTVPAQIVQRLEWITPRPAPQRPPRRRGPAMPVLMAQRS